MSTSKTDTKRVITSFRGDNAFLSNFHPSAIEMDGVLYPTVEHAYQAAKTTDTNVREYISKLYSGAAAKKYGCQVTIRPDWLTVRLAVMEDLLKKKFDRVKHPGLVKQLLATEDKERIEGNTWGDRFWGVCAGRGQNHLGLLLMDVRKALQELPDYKVIN